MISKYNDFKDSLYKVRHESLVSFDNRVFIFSITHFVLLSIYLVLYKDVQSVELLHTAWTINGFVILLNIYSHLLMYYLHGKTIKEIDSAKYSQRTAINRNKVAMSMNLVICFLISVVVLLQFIIVMNQF